MSVHLGLRSKTGRDDRLGRERPFRLLASRRWSVGATLRTLVASAVVASGLLTAAAPSAMAYGTAYACTGRTMAPYFQGFGDYNQYFRISNGGFENGSTDWLLNGNAAVVSGNEPYRVAGATDSRDLFIGAGASAESHTLCVSMGEDKVRLFAYNPGVIGAILHVDIVVRNPTTNTYGYYAWDLNANAMPYGWQPTPWLTIPNVFNGSSTEELTITLSTRGSAANWLVDDVMVDPFKSY